jgi:hypothetical protein
MVETWKQIAANPNYWVSDLGRVKSDPAQPYQGKPGRILKPNERRNQYGRLVCLTVNLSWPGKTYKTARVHRLVLEAFIGPAPDGCEACHYDGNPANNRLDNLRWDTKAANQRDIDRHGTRSPPPTHIGEKHPLAKLRAEDVAYIRARGPGDAAALAARFGVSRKTIYRVKRGEGRALG